jgi:CBS domain containing-hemolysin-like protein
MAGMIDQVPETLLVALVVAGVGVGALLSAAESATQRITRAAVAEMRQEGRRRADAVERVVAHRQAALEAVAFFRILAETVAAVSLTLVVADLLPRWWQVLLVAVAVSVLLVAVVVGASPREYGRRRPERVLHALAGPVLALLAVTQPFRVLAERIRPRTPRTEHEEREEAAEDLRDMVDLVSESEQIEDDERSMLHSVFELGRTLTREVMVPRTDMITIALDTPLDKALALFTRSGFSRVPVIGDGVDDMRGMLYLKDALRAMRRAGEELTAADAMRPVRFVPEMKLVDDLLREMQAESSHIAVVVDEYGGVAGLVTIEDLLEELVGELQDEHDADLPAVEDLGEGTFRIPARMAVDELGDLFDLEVDDDDVDTAGGLLAKALGKVPIEGAEADILGLHLVAERADGRRRQISTMLVSRSEDEDET